MDGIGGGGSFFTAATELSDDCAVREPHRSELAFSVASSEPASERPARDDRRRARLMRRVGWRRAADEP